MLTTTGNHFSNSTNTTESLVPTKSREQLLIQSSGAMIAVIVIGIFIILTVVLIIVKIYHRCTQTSRLMGRSKKSRTKSSMYHTNLQTARATSSASGSDVHSGNGFQLPRAELSSQEQSNAEHLSTISDSTVVTIHSTPPVDNT
ncbi:hypothetical protein GJAV_G00001630 [Gymnothorax javanicus]|nr:hypothetical protein GJAV_G00001630 [Gymnothorax javanicus]